MSPEFCFPRYFSPPRNEEVEKRARDLEAKRRRIKFEVISGNSQAERSEGGS